jgi:nicotinate-nucleotide pyrophosphorylase (carboxylating)
MKPLPSDPLADFAASLELLAEPIVRAALLEDIGRGGDLTTEAIVGPQRRADARIVARERGIVAGLAIASLAFRFLDGEIEIAPLVRDGERIEPGGGAAEIRGRARTILTGERVALNLLCRLSGIATATRRLVDLVSPTAAKIVGTRKTTPGLRGLERYAVACGGGGHHRFGLDDGVLIKDNHLVVAGSVRAAVAAARAHAGHMVKIEVEVDTLDQLREALEQPIDAVLLDNMTPATLAQAVAIVNRRVLVEASGGVTAANVGAIARTGVDLISVGSITHSAPGLDFALDVESTER